ncbi:MAG: argininosuccinate lyase [Myxococcales bacterium]|nr:argininosuccinate lyase [Polyangiaceae bacterium]MDW8250878.1 argininosuccinate lyase [Myxococcales bacterium]
MTTQRTWGGRFEATPAEAMLRLSASVDVDRTLWRDDIEGSIAHARGLHRAGVLTEDELVAIEEGLRKVGAEIERGTFFWDPSKEDVHMNIEARLIELIGPIGGKLHTGRSRNDQVATDLRLYTRRRCGEILEWLAALRGAILDQAVRHVDTLLPGYTHLQRAQPVRLAHHLLAWQEMLERDAGRVADARRRLNELPLGSGAIAGTTFPIDREQLAAELGFERPTRNSIDGTASRDFLMETVNALAILGVHLSRIGEELVLWSSQEFGFVELSDTFSTGSSMMPQKKNPDVAELVRGRSARVIGQAVALMVLEKGLPLGYNRDLQEDKPSLFDAVETTVTSLEALTGAIASATFRPDRMVSALRHGYVGATELADYLALRGVPFREAHEVIGRLVKLALQQGVGLEELPLTTLKEAHEAFDEGAYRVLDNELAVERRGLLGGPARARVLAEIEAARARLAG